MVGSLENFALITSWGGRIGYEVWLCDHVYWEKYGAMSSSYMGTGTLLWGNTREKEVA